MSLFQTAVFLLHAGITSINPDLVDKFFPSSRKPEFHAIMGGKEDDIMEGERSHGTQYRIEGYGSGPDPEIISATPSATQILPNQMLEISNIDLSFLDNEQITKGVNIEVVDASGNTISIHKITIQGHIVPTTNEQYYSGLANIQIAKPGNYTLRLVYQKSTATGSGRKKTVTRSTKKIPLGIQKNPLKVNCELIKKNDFSGTEFLSAMDSGNIGNRDSVAIIVRDSRIALLENPILRIGISDYPLHKNNGICYFIVPKVLFSKTPKANCKILSGLGLNAVFVSDFPLLEDIISAEFPPLKKASLLSKKTETIRPGVLYKINPGVSSFVSNTSIEVNGKRVDILSQDVEKGTYEFIMPSTFSGNEVTVKFSYTESGRTTTQTIGSWDISNNAKKTEVKTPTLPNLTVNKDFSISFKVPNNFNPIIHGVVFRNEAGKERSSNIQVDMIVTHFEENGELYIKLIPLETPNFGNGKVQCIVSYGPESGNIFESRALTVPR